MKKLYLTVIFLGTLSFSGAVLSSTEPVHLVSQQIERAILVGSCKLVRSSEPKGDFAYSVKTRRGIMKVTRPIFSDLCRMPTAQFTTRIFYYLSESERSPIVGVTGENEDSHQMAFPVFSSFALRKFH